MISASILPFRDHFTLKRLNNLLYTFVEEPDILRVMKRYYPDYPLEDTHTHVVSKAGRQTGLCFKQHIPVRDIDR